MSIKIVILEKRNIRNVTDPGMVFTYFLSLFCYRQNIYHLQTYLQSLPLRKKANLQENKF